MKTTVRIASAMTLATVMCVAAGTRAATPTTRTTAVKTKTPVVTGTKPNLNVPPCGYELTQPGLQPTYQRVPTSKQQPALKASPMIGAIGDTVPLKAKLSLDGKPVHSHTLHFRVNNGSVGSSKTNAQGEARVMYKVPNQMGAKTIQVRYNGSAECKSVQDTANFGTVKSATRLYLESPSGTIKAGGKLYMQGSLKRITDQLGLDGREVSLSVNGKPIGKVTTVNGRFSVNYDVPANAQGTLSVAAQFEGDVLYVPYLVRRHVNVLPPRVKVYLHWFKAEGSMGQNIALKACLGRSETIPCQQPVAGQKVRFWADRGTRWHYTVRVPQFNLGSANTGSNGWATATWRAELSTNQVSNKDLPQSYTLYAHADVDSDRYILVKKSDPQLRVLKSPTHLSVLMPKNLQIGKPVKVTLKLTRSTDGQGLKGAKVSSPFGNLTTSDSGMVISTFTVPSQTGTGSKTLVFKYGGEYRYGSIQANVHVQVAPSTN